MSASLTPLARTTAILVVATVALRLIAAAVTPLAFDEAYYWMWSQHLAGGYLDHPPMVALVIRAGTIIAGHTELGVRLVSILLALPMSWAVYRSAEILFRSERVAATATILLNATLVVAVGTLIVTPDAPLMVASSFVLLFLAKILQTGRGIWWLATGIAVGLALLSKYTALFFGLSILLWLLVVPQLRHWLRSPWPYLGGIIAFALFSPVVFWNANHAWVSFIKQFGRARGDSLTLRFIGEFIPAQIGFATPLVFVLGVMGLIAMLRRGGDNPPARALINLTIWPIVIYFLLHSLHSHIEANWLAPVYPAFVIAAAVAVHQTSWSPRWQTTAEFCRRWALPGGLIMFALLIVQANTGWLSAYQRDPTVRSIGVGLPALAGEVEAARRQSGAACVLATDYGTTSWLAFYLPRGTCVAQLHEPIRWINMPVLDATALAGSSLLVDENPALHTAALGEACPDLRPVGDARRQRGPLTIESYKMVLLNCPLGSIRPGLRSAG